MHFMDSETWRPYNTVVEIVICSVNTAAKLFQDCHARMRKI